MNAPFKKIIFLFFPVFLSGYCFSQLDSATYYLDKNGGLCIKEKAMYMAKGVEENNKYKLFYFILATGNLIKQISYTDFTMAVMDGPYAEYDEDGKTMMTNGNYVNNKEHGYWTYWYGGYLTDSVLFENGMDMTRVSLSYNDKGKLRSRTLNEAVTQTFEITTFDDNGNLTRHTKWVKGSGDQIFYYPTGQVKMIEKYKNKEVTRIEYFNPDGSEVSEKEMKKIEEKLSPAYTNQMGQAPEYPGGWAGFNSFFNRNFKVPASFGRQGFSDLVIVTFFLDKAGFAYDIKVSGSNNRDIEIEVLTVFRRMNAWNMHGYQKFGPITYTLNLSPN